MTSPTELLQQWGKDETAERQLLDLIEAAINRAVSAALRRWRAAKSLGAEIHQDLWVWLLEHRLEPLRMVRAETPERFRSFVEVVVRRFANRWLHVHFRADRRERGALVDYRSRDRSGATDTEIRAALEDAEPTLTEKDRRLLDELVGEARPVGVAPVLGDHALAVNEGRSAQPKWRDYKALERLYRKLREAFRR